MLRVNPEYQRGLRWSDFHFRGNRCLSIVIMRGYSIPAFYLHEIEIPGIRGQRTHSMNIIDGQLENRPYMIFQKAVSHFLIGEEKRFPEFKFSNVVNLK